METFKAGWFVIYTKPHHEKKVSTLLMKEKIVSFLPTIKKLRTWCDRKKYIDAPLFPSYLFVNLTSDKSYFQSLQVSGILYYLKFGKEIASIGENVINNIKKLTHCGSELIVSDEHIFPGASLLILQGPFTGLHCEVVQYEGREKIIVRIDLLKRNILLNLPVENVFQSPLDQNQFNRHTA
jgi:transcriptional antiterminator RfaH